MRRSGHTRGSQGREGRCPAGPHGPGNQPVVGGNVPLDATLASGQTKVFGRRRCLCAAPRAWHVGPARFPLLSHSFLPRSEGMGGPGPLALAARRVVGGICEEGSRSPLYGAPARPQASGLGFCMPGQPTGPFCQAPLSHSRATRSCHCPGAGGSRALGVAVRFRDRSGRVQRAPTHSGPVGRVLVVGRGWSSRPPTPFQNLNVSPLRSASPLLTKEDPCSFPSRAHLLAGGGVRPSKWVFCAHTFGPRSLHPTSFASRFDVC